MAQSPSVQNLALTVLVTTVIAGLGVAGLYFGGRYVLEQVGGTPKEETAGPDQRTSAQIEREIAALERAADAFDESAAEPSTQDNLLPQVQENEVPPEPRSDRLPAVLTEQAAETLKLREERRQAALTAPLGKSLFTIDGIRSVKRSGQSALDESLPPGSAPPAVPASPVSLPSSVSADVSADPVATGRALAAPTSGIDSYSVQRPGQVLLAAGSIIPAVLVDEIRSDLPGLIRATITNDVYGTLEPGHVVIPRGSMLVGTYASQTRPGQRRLFITWTRILFPNGVALDLEQAGGVDADGASGIKGRRRTGFFTAILGTAMISTAQNVGRKDTTNSDIAEAARIATGTAVGTLSDQYFGNTLSQGPTFAVRAGTILNAQTERDFYLKGYNQ